MVVSAFLESINGLISDPSEAGSAIDLVCDNLVSVNFYETAAPYNKPVYIKKDSNLLIKRGLLTFDGAEGLRAGRIQANTPFPAFAGLQFGPDFQPGSVDTFIHLPVFNSWFDIGVIIPAQISKPFIELRLANVSGWYDARNIPSLYSGHLFAARLSLDIEGVEHIL